MLTGSTSALISLPTRLPCRFSCSQGLFPGRRLAAVTCLQRGKSLATSHGPQSVLKEQRVADICSPIVSPRPHLPGPAINAVSLLDAPNHQPHAGASCDNAPGPVDIKWTARRRRTLLWLMLTAKSPDRAWAAYQELLLHRATIPSHSLHRLVRLLASVKPRTRTVHLQLLSALKTLQWNHGRLRVWEWNTLIDSAGKQWRKTRLEDYENALDIFNKKGVLPVSASEVVDPSVTQQGPDIWTHNILLSIASRSNLPHAVRHASSLLLASNLPPNRSTHLCLLRYFTVRNDLRSVRSTLNKMKQQGLELGLDGVNACLWAYARNRRLDVALSMYRVLRSHIEPTPYLDKDEDARYVRDTIGLDIPDGLAPDVITYTMMIQSLAYHGDLKNALSVFVDMLSTPNREADNGAKACYQPSMAAFRGLFLGFARHAQDPEHFVAEAEVEGETDPVTALFPCVHGSWDLDTLETVFAAFLQLPDDPKPTPRIVYWILVAFDKASGRDAVKLREVWDALEAKYGGGWSGRLENIRRSIYSGSLESRESYD